MMLGSRDKLLCLFLNLQSKWWVIESPCLTCSFVSAGFGGQK